MCAAICGRRRVPTDPQITDRPTGDRSTVRYQRRRLTYLVSPFANRMRNGVRLLVKGSINGWQSNHGCLPSFNHGEPDQTTPECHKGKHRMNILGERSLLLEHEGVDHDQTEDQQGARDNALHNVGGSRHGGMRKRELLRWVLWILLDRSSILLFDGRKKNCVNCNKRRLPRIAKHPKSKKERRANSGDSRPPNLVKELTVVKRVLRSH